jgi:hypothetical protein
VRLAPRLALLGPERQAWRVSGLLSLAAVVPLLFAPASRASGEPLGDPGREACAAQQLDYFVGFGDPAAAKLLEVYIDPVEPDQLQLWLEALRIVGERPQELRVELIPTRGGRAHDDSEADIVRLWFTAAAALGAGEAALRLLDGQDWQRIAVQARAPEGRAALARELGLDPAAFEARRSGLAGACLARSFERLATQLAVQTMGQYGTVVGLVDARGRRQIAYVDPQLTDLRQQIDRFGANIPQFDDRAIGFVPFGPSLSGRSSRLDRAFPSTGVLVGGEALPHRLVIFVEDEEHGRLPDWLAPAMRYRGHNPGQLSVQVIAAGVGSRAISLRRRLCAARALGLEVEYLLHLSARPSVRRLHEDALAAVLDPVANSEACSDSEPLDPGPAESGPEGGRGSDFGHPRGAWLDGRPVNPSDLDSLEWRFAVNQGPSVLDWLLTPENFGSGSFEF